MGRQTRKGSGVRFPHGPQKSWSEACRAPAIPRGPREFRGLLSGAPSPSDTNWVMREATAFCLYSDMATIVTVFPMKDGKEPDRTPWDECLTVTGSIEKKADKYKLWSRLSVLGLTVLPASIPVLIGLGDTWFLSKALPSILAAASALLATWVQLERPHERWRLYRRYHRVMQAEQLNYRFAAGPYTGLHDRERLLAERLGVIQLQLHDEWEGLIPSAAELTNTSKHGPDD